MCLVKLLLLLAVLLPLAFRANVQDGNSNSIDDFDGEDLFEGDNNAGRWIDDNAGINGHSVDDLAEYDNVWSHEGDAGDQEFIKDENSVKFQALSFGNAVGYNSAPVKSSKHAGMRRKLPIVPAHRRPAAPVARGGPLANLLTTQPVPTIPASFDSFNNSRPQNAGTCVEAINQVRVAAGLKKLVLDDQLSQLCARHSAYMAATHEVSHDGFWAFRFDGVPINSTSVGEVVCSDDMLNAPNGAAKRACDRWMESQEHKTLLLSTDMVGCGCSTTEGTDGKFYATAMVTSKMK